MKTSAAACAALLALAALTGCSGDGSDGKPEKPAATVTAAKTVDPAAARQACVDAWAEAIDADTTNDLGLEDEPAECAGLPEDDQLDRYMDGLTQRNKAARDAFDQYTDEGAAEDAQP